jgi:hypothetical protein
MKTESLTSIGRSIDPSYPTNLAIIVVSLIAGGVGSLFRWMQTSDLASSLIWGGVMGLTAFLSWALAREIDPDYELSAFVAVVAGLYLLWALGPPVLLYMFAFLLHARVLNRCTGLPLRWGDSLAVLVLSGWLAIADHWLFGVLAAIVFLMDWRLSPSTRRHVWFALASLIPVGIAFLLQSCGPILIAEVTPELLWGIPIVLLFFWVISDSRNLSTKADFTETILSGSRVQSLQLIVLLSVILAGLFGGVAWIGKLGPLVGSIVGISLYRIPGKLRLPRDQG